MQNSLKTIIATAVIICGFAAVYEYGSVVLPAIDVNQAIKFIEKGIRKSSPMAALSSTGLYLLATK